MRGARGGMEPYDGRQPPRPGEAIFDQGLAFDLETLPDRRRMLRVMGLSGLGLALAACAPATSSSGSSETARLPASRQRRPARIRSRSRRRRRDRIPRTARIARTSSTRPGSYGATSARVSGASPGRRKAFPLSIRLALQGLATGEPLSGAAVYAWHCGRDGRYSLYTVTDQNYLRGVQGAGDDGVVTFTSIFPACYPGRWPHIHFEVYPDLAAASDDANAIATSQIALPEATCHEVYATEGYEQSVSTLSQISLQTDNVFGDDGGIHELGTVTGDVRGGLTVTLTVPVET